MDVNEYKEVYYNEYCKKCVHEKEKGYDTPCEECLDNPINLHSHKPVNFKEKEK